MIKAILTLTALNLVLMPLTYLVHVNAINLTDCSPSAYLSSDDTMAKFRECKRPKSVVFLGDTPSPALSYELPGDMTSFLAGPPRESSIN